MKVLIVAKTRQGSRACIGGIAADGRSVRLVAADAETSERAGMEYAVGEVWEVDAAPAGDIMPPHVENTIVRAGRKFRSVADPVPAIERCMPPKHGGIDVLYDGLTQATTTGALYIAEKSGIPSYSTMFWRPDQSLQRDDEGKRIRYRYATPDGGRTLVFIGFQEPVDVIPAGALLRVSLAHWWRPENAMASEPRCYVQLSGWFLPASSSALPDSHSRPAAALPDKAVMPEHHPDLADAQRLLKSVFGYDDFRPLQAEIIANLLDRRDTLAVMPTGSGKSLCFQLPALLFDGLTVVVSPLIALMQDQVDQLREVGVEAAFLNSTLGYREYMAATGRVKRGQTKILYTSPETLLRPETLVMLDGCRVDCLAIDEAHCISEWGHDFRPDYREMLPVRKRYPDAVCVAFTATATPRVQQDIKLSLGLRDENEFIASFNRENLYLEVRPRTDGLGQTLAFLEAHRDQSGIIYCSTRQGVDELAARLGEKKWSVLPYHAGMDNETRLRNQTRFSRDEVPIIVATIAFGMGINKSNVRFVLHHNMPQSLEGYYQEIGRAGRDGLRADCLLLFSHADLQTIYGFIEKGAESEKPGRHARLQAMVRYAEAQNCRRVPLLGYFGEPATAPVCGFCDNCLGTTAEEQKVDCTDAAREFLLCVKLTGQVFGPAHVVDVLRGSRGQKVLRFHHDRLTSHGVGRGHSAAQWRHFAEQFVRQGLLEQDMEHGSLRLTSKGRDVLGGAQVFVAAQPSPMVSPAARSDHDGALFERLRALRRQVAEENNLPPFVVFSDRSLVEMATYYPQSESGFLAIHGVGEYKLKQHGERFLMVIRDYCAEHDLQERARPARSGDLRASSAAGKNRSEEVGEQFAAGRSVADLQAIYGVTKNTIVNHLLRCVRAGRVFPPERIRELSTLSAADQERVFGILGDLGPDYLSPLFQALDGTVSYDELHIMRLVYLCAQRVSLP